MTRTSRRLLIAGLFTASLICSLPARAEQERGQGPGHEARSVWSFVLDSVIRPFYEKWLGSVTVDQNGTGDDAIRSVAGRVDSTERSPTLDPDG